MRPYAEVDTAWLVACLALTALGVFAAVLTFRKRGASSGIRVLGWGLLPIAVWLTGLSRLLWTVVLEGARWVGGLVLSPRVWVGVALFLVAFVMLGGVGFVRRRRAKSSGAAKPAGGAGSSGGKSASDQSGQGTGSGAAKGQVEKKQGKDDPLEGMEDIEAILKRRGIE